MWRVIGGQIYEIWLLIVPFFHLLLSLFYVWNFGKGHFNKNNVTLLMHLSNRTKRKTKRKEAIGRRGVNWWSNA